MYSCQECSWAVVNHTIRKLFRYLHMKCGEREKQCDPHRDENWDLLSKTTFHIKLRLYQAATLYCSSWLTCSLISSVCRWSLFIYLFLLSSYPSLFSSFVFLSFLTHFPLIDLSVFLSICFLCSFLLDSHIKQDIELHRFIYLNFHNSEEISNSSAGFKGANWQILVVPEITLWK